ncbi:MAG: hypothetical protein MJ001_03845 [Paludibacteraceae bacterium]|nr:hypothetical protein [Paludibacteraceae bacterium]
MPFVIDEEQRTKKEELSGKHDAAKTVIEGGEVVNDYEEIRKEEFPGEQDAPKIIIEDDGVVSDYEKPRNATDPKTINVRIIDQKPIVILFGAKSTGKTMTLVRLGKYLHNQSGYTLDVDKLFCTTDVWEYKVNSRNFNSMLGTTKALPGTNNNDFLFVNVTKKRETVCHILEAAGEDYFPTRIANGGRDPEAEFPAYMSTVFNSGNKKLWVFIVDAEWTNGQDCSDYVDRIRYVLNKRCSNNDEFLLLYNKADKEGYVTAKCIDNDNAKIRCYGQYGGIEKVFENPSRSPFARRYLHDFQAFSTGEYHKGGQYTKSMDFVPEALWKLIVKKLHI